MTLPRPSMHPTACPDGGTPDRIHDATVSGLYALALRITGAAGEAESVVAQTLIEAWRADPAAAPGLPFASLARRCRALALVRSGKRSIGSVWLRAAARPPASAREASAAPDVGTARARAAGALAGLGELDRRVLEMIYFEGYGVAEVALGTGLSPRDVVARLRRAVAAFGGPGPARGRIALSAPPARPAPGMRARLLATIGRDP